MKRRQFLQNSAWMSAWGATALGASRAVEAVPRIWTPEDQALVERAREIGRGKRVALIGTGWYGKCDLLRLIQVADVNVVALCDVDRNMLGEAIDIVAERQHSKQRPRGYSDYRKLLAEEELDLVLIDTPDHWHCLPMIAACQAGVDVWVQKPVGVDVIEGEAMLQAARKHERVVQVGTQRRSTPHLMEAKRRIIDEGKLGKIGHAEVYCYYHMRSRETPPDTAPPEYLDYEMWTGPAPMRPYNKLVHPRSWRAFMEYGNGILGDMCVHMLDMVRWMLDLDWPRQVHSIGGVHVEKDKKANISDCQTACFDFEDLSVVWQHRSWGSAVDPEYPWGATLYGDRGTLKLSVNRWDFIPFGGGQPESGKVQFEFEEYPEDEHEKDLERHVAPAIRQHMRDWLVAVADRTKPIADIRQGHISSSSCVLANMSMELGRSLIYDPETRTIPGDAEATEKLARPYRMPWKHPEVTS